MNSRSSGFAAVAAVACIGLGACFSSSSGGSGPDASFELDSGVFDGSIDSSEGQDATAPDGSGPEASSGADSSTGVDSGHDASSDGEVESGTAEAGSDAAPEASVDASCGSTLNDPNNCGACGHSCQGGGCSGGLCGAITLVTGRTNPYGITVDANNVYWTESYDGAPVMSVPIAGGTATTLASGRNYPNDIAVDAHNVYWADGDATMYVPIGGGTAVTIAPLVSPGGGQGPSAIALDPGGADIYWSNDNEYMGTLLDTPFDGGTPTTLASSLVYPNTLVRYGTNLFFSVNGYVLSIPAAGGAVATLASMGGDTAAALAVSSAGIYWTDNDLGGVVTVGLDGGTATTLATNTIEPSGIAVDGTYVYWTTYGSPGAVMRLPLAGGTPITMVSGLNYPAQLAVDSTFLYWTEEQGGTIKKVAK